MKHVNENPYEFFSTGGWGFLGAPNGEEQESDGESGSESEYEHAPSESDYSEESGSESNFDDGSDASDDEGSGSDFSEGEDWDELERKAAKCKWNSASNYFLLRLTSLAADKKVQEEKKAKGDELDGSNSRTKRAPPKGKVPAKPQTKTNGKVGKKSNGKR